jgi:type I restriction enzyme S subunit
VKAIATINDETLSDSVDPEYEIEYVDIGSVSLANGIEKTEAMAFGESPSRARRVPREGDVLVSTVRTYLKAIAPVVNQPSNLVASTGFAVIRPRPELEPGFLKYALQEEHFIQEVISRSTGVSYPAINASDIGRVLVCFPSRDEQLAIASFLNRETAKIDALIAEQQRLIELLQEKRQAVISHAVTKGLNPHAPMKDSGVEWLGEVPEHWEVKQVRHLIKSLTQGTSPSCLQEPAGDGEYGVLKVGCVNEVAFLPAENKKLPSDTEPDLASLIEPGDVLVSRGNTKELVGLAALATKASQRLLASDLIFVLRACPQQIYPQFLALALRSQNTRAQIEPRTVGTSPSMQKVNQSTVKELLLAVPPLKEQQEITDSLTEWNAWSEKGIRDSRSAIQLLQERRSALISAAVTGQIDVREPAIEEEP